MIALTADELAYLAAWAREELHPDCWLLPAHQLQAKHRVPSISFIGLIKAWAQAEGKKDTAIYSHASSNVVVWPWDSQHVVARLRELTATPA